MGKSAANVTRRISVAGSQDLARFILFIFTTKVSQGESKHTVTRTNISYRLEWCWEDLFMLSTTVVHQ